MGGENSENEVFDIVVIGGGINGAGIARDAAGRGLKVLLCEKDDFGQHTSSASTKLIHGGLRYLENYHFKLVRNSLREREILLRNSPHIIWPLRFVLPYDQSIRPRWMIRAGLFIYDSLAPMNLLERSRQVDLRHHAAGVSLQAGLRYGFEYSDCWVQDSRLVVLNVADAAAAGACVLSRTKCTDLKRESQYWRVTLKRENGVSPLPDVCHIRARVVVNATGAWVDSIAREFHGAEPSQVTQLVRGSHIVVRKLFDHQYAYIFQHPDNRILFCIPYERDFTLIGTTEVAVDHVTDESQITNLEIDYLCTAVNRYLNQTITPQNVIWSYSGVRVLCGKNSRDTSQLSRDYSIKFDNSLAPIVSVFGGKITTYRLLAEDVMSLLKSIEGFDKPKWTHDAKLPGGDLNGLNITQYAEHLGEKYSWLPQGLVYRLACHYGSNTHMVLKDCYKVSDLGEQFTPDLYQAEVDYLIQHEFVRSAEDIVWRRTRQGIQMDSAGINRLNEYIESTLNIEDVNEVTFNASLHT